MIRTGGTLDLGVVLGAVLAAIGGTRSGQGTTERCRLDHTRHTTFMRRRCSRIVTFIAATQARTGRGVRSFTRLDCAFFSLPASSGIPVMRIRGSRPSLIGP